MNSLKLLAQTKLPVIPKNIETSISGTHVIEDLWGCDAKLINDGDYILALIERAAEEANATILQKSIHCFEPQGVTALLLLAESHLSIHTWPEHNFAAIDIFTCGTTMKPELAAAIIRRSLRTKTSKRSSIERGKA